MTHFDKLGDFHLSTDNEKLKESISIASHLTRNLTAAYFELTGTIPSLLNGGHISEIPPKALEKCRVFSNRYIAVKESWPKNAKILEIGTQTGIFANYIAESVDPKELHLIDISYDLFNDDLRFALRMTKHEGRSSEIIKQFSESYFDVAYIDASHDYADVKSDLEGAKRIVKDGGLIVCNDYVWYSPAEMSEYGVIRAVNEIINDDEFNILYIALHTHGFFDIAFINQKKIENLTADAS